MRVDFAGGWLDTPAYAVPGAYVVNCAIQPLVSLARWGYRKNSGLGGSAAWAALNGANPVDTELKSAGWQDPAVILETGLCVWRSGKRPVLEAKYNPDWLTGRMALLYTGKPHKTAEIIGKWRDYAKIVRAAGLARLAVIDKSISALCQAVKESYAQQLEEGMPLVEVKGCSAAKYCGSGFGGYMLCLFCCSEHREQFINEHKSDAVVIEPYLAPL